MKKNKHTYNKTIASLLCIAFLFVMSCKFGDINLDPTRPIDAELKEILPAALTQTAHNISSIGSRVTGTVIQQLKGIDAQPEAYSLYLIDERTLNDFWRTGLYGGAMKDCNILISKAEELNRPHYQGIAKILMAINLGIATTLWGEVPFEGAFNGIDNLQPKYDTQQDIYKSIQQLLREAINHLQQVPSENPPHEEDLIFNGDTAKWIATAYALKARYFLHLSKREIASAENALTAIQSSELISIEHQPNFPFGQNINEAFPMPLFCFERPDQLMMSDYLFHLLEENNDPRMERLTIVQNGNPIIFQQDSAQLYWGQFNTPLPLISLSELNFIEAEAFLRIGNINDAEKFFQDAVIAHCEQMEIPFAEYQNFIQEKINFDNHPNFEEKLEWLIQQKHIALFAQNAIEAWVDYRRTGYPQLEIPASANSSFNPSLVIPRRYLYPISERNANLTHLEEAKLRQGGHLLDNEMWAFE